MQLIWWNKLTSLLVDLSYSARALSLACSLALIYFKFDHLLWNRSLVLNVVLHEVSFQPSLFFFLLKFEIVPHFRAHLPGFEFIEEICQKVEELLTPEFFNFSE
jgi:hypothetical protein